MSLPMDEQFALRILQPYKTELEWTAPEQTIHNCREKFLAGDPNLELSHFTAGLKVLLERRYLKRLNDERLELTPNGRAWLENNDGRSQDTPA